MIPTALTIAGSDPSGGAGIQADLKTFSSLGVYGMSVVAALTAQNTQGVRDVMHVTADFVGLQLDAVLTDIPPAAVKTGMLGTAAVVDIVAHKIRRHGVTHLVVDPVMVSSSGVHLLEHSGEDMLKRALLPLALVVTPNLSEASVLTGVEVNDLLGMEEAARRLHRMGARNVLVKGGHLEGDATDVFFDGSRMHRLSSPRASTKNLHGTGCVLSAAITAWLASGVPLEEAVQRAKRYVTEAIANSLRLGKGTGPVNAGRIGLF
ncbi:MAG TPA: bifunctional hydroxymethylpyrimidine kinase/phosphomethylpyrimidine kinase [Terriglobia bacterium]|nr:bifunctional hydroxymethylpyrimidine kinase/phosphomethylpyrimidine kinase [Terriglobia bacterium]